MSQERQIDKCLIFTSLTLNSTTLYTYDETSLTSLLNVNCSELIARELGTIDATLESRSGGSVPISTNAIFNNKYVNLVMYYSKRLLSNNDLITIVTIVDDRLLKEFVVHVLDKVLSKFIDLKARIDNSNGNNNNGTGSINSHDLSEFKNDLEKIIKEEESKYIRNLQSYGSIDETQEELSEVRNIMNENIERVLDREERINLLVNKTDRINNTANSFRRRTIAIKKKFWWSNFKIKFYIGLLILILLYIIIGSECGLPFYSKCIHHSDPPKSGE
ncbi:unnamed protein product [[Candida] boidinii]|uniref:Unnamed protein product n=1 Tax=Candida boidinii TaxID=5477 RepID=A0A9W6T1M7_CANBO|nr:hypothetical protein B5S30_g3890 [[Candida] boidinii]GME74115.1 unnamed protein product [[Candida] boidinii]GMG20824.1 unnamed protein product [[Candida] boidinii]